MWGLFEASWILLHTNKQFRIQRPKHVATGEERVSFKYYGGQVSWCCLSAVLHATKEVEAGTRSHSSDTRPPPPRALPISSPSTVNNGVRSPRAKDTRAPGPQGKSVSWSVQHGRHTPRTTRTAFSTLYCTVPCTSPRAPSEQPPPFAPIPAARTCRTSRL